MAAPPPRRAGGSHRRRRRVPSLRPPAHLGRRPRAALEYPAAARRRGLSGTVHLEIALEATGQVSDVLLVRSSSHALLDTAALDAARNLRRVPFPPDVRPRALRVRLPVVFEL